VAGFWKAPKQLARLRAEGRLTARAYELVHFLAESGADRPEGFATSVGWLIDALGGSDSTMRRTLRALRDFDLIAYEDHSGRAVFVVKTTSTLADLADGPRSQPRSKPASGLTDRVTDPVTEVGEKPSERDRGSGGRKPAPVKVANVSLASDVTEVSPSPETENEIENKKKAGPLARSPASVVPLKASTGTQELVAYFAERHREETGEPAPKRLVGHVANQVDEMLREGVSAPTLARTLGLLIERRLHPSTLPSLVAEAAAGPRRDREHPADRLVRDLLEDGP
jgi:hypothetical protein